jgi:hypothetical protein
MTLGILAWAGLAHGETPRADAEATLANAAWRVAARVSSSIDAGSEMIRVAGRLGAAGRADLVEKWAQERHESWIRSGALAHAASAEFLRGGPARAAKLLQEAHEESERTTEWRRPLTADALSVSEALARLAPTATNDFAGAVRALSAWIAAGEPQRAYAAAWACAHLAGRTTATHDRTILVAEVMRLTQPLLPWQRLELLAVVAPSLRSADQRAACVAVVDGFSAALTNAPASHGTYEVVVRAAHVCHAVGASERGEALLADALRRVERLATGDDPAPKLVLAETLLAMGRNDRARAALIQGMADVNRQPGFNRDIALARTLTALATSGIEWTNDEIDGFLKTAQ